MKTKKVISGLDLTMEDYLVTTLKQVYFVIMKYQKIKILFHMPMFMLYVWMEITFGLVLIPED